MAKALRIKSTTQSRYVATSDATYPQPRRYRLLHRVGGADGNEILTCAIAAVLTVLLALEGITVVHMEGLLGAHMFIGLVLIPPVALKLASTGYRSFRYYTRACEYRAKGPPRLPLRAVAPVFVASAIGVFVTGVLLLAIGHRSNFVLGIHKVSFIVFGVLFVLHFLAYLPRTLRSLCADWRQARREKVPGSGLRATLVALGVGGGVVLAVSMLHAIDDWHGRHAHSRGGLNSQPHRLRHRGAEPPAFHRLSQPQETINPGSLPPEEDTAPNAAPPASIHPERSFDTAGSG